MRKSSHILRFVFVPCTLTPNFMIIGKGVWPQSSEKQTDTDETSNAQVITKTAEAHKSPESKPVSSRIVNTLLLNQSVMKCARWSSKSCLTLMRRTRRGWTILAAQGWDLTNGHSPRTRERWTGPGVIYRSLDEFTIKPIVRQETTPFIHFRALWNTTVYS